ncbi:MAG: hypothetical protein J3Q66DRAFT_270402, partial [Benniella sp.]
GLQYIQKCIIKDRSAPLLLWITTKSFRQAATAAVMRHIEETRNATFLNRSVRFKYQICEGSMVIDCATAQNLELTVNLSTRNDNKNPLWYPEQMLTLMGGRPLRSNILQPLTDGETINTRLDCVHGLIQSEETFFSLRTAPKVFNDVDHLI